ncbi:outer membrane protein [Labrys okinawensis]|uniref:outer membrane protein n=1 Tax=Labrys okinawensis TaxID=346911 RepID=UPI0039BD06C2
MRYLPPALPVLATLVFCGAAAAADLAPRVAEPVAPAAATFSWTGFYAGLHAGAAFNKADTSAGAFDGLGRLDEKLDSTGFVGGVHVGYNQQFDGGFVVGIEGDIDYRNLNKKKAVPGDSFPAPGGGDVDASAYRKIESDWQGSLRARAGYAIGNILPYLTAGVAFSDEKYTDGQATTGYSSFRHENSTVIGWTAGAGVEYAMTDNWLVRGEVRYTDFGSKSFRFSDDDDRTTVKLREISTTLGVSYKF